MPRLYASTGDGIARLDESDGAWQVALSLRGSGAQCLAVDPSDADVVYAGLRAGGVRRTSDGGRPWADCELPAPGVFSVAASAVDGAVYAGTEPSALFRSDDGGQTWRESAPCWSCRRGRRGASRRGRGPRTSAGSRSARGAQRDVHSLAWHPRA